MKKKILALVMVLIIGAFAIGGTLAYFTEEETARNVITTGAVDITVIEQTKGEDGKLTDYPTEPQEAMPGSEISKIVTIRNEEAESWIRAKAVVTVKKGETVMQYAPEMIRIDYDTEKWTEKDGWYYYNESVKTGKTTDALFTTVTFDGESMGNEFMDTEITVDVAAQAVQTANNGTDALTAAGWPKAE